MAATYRPTAAEIEAFERDLTEYTAYVDEEGGDFRESDLRVLAQHHWPDQNARVRSTENGVGWIDSYPDQGSTRQQPAAADPAAGSEQAAPEQSELPEATLHKLAQGIKDPRMRAILEKAKPMVVGGLEETTVIYGPEGIRSIDGRKPTADETAQVGYVPGSFSMKQTNDMLRAEQLQRPTCRRGTSAQRPTCRVTPALAQRRGVSRRGPGKRSPQRTSSPRPQPASWAGVADALSVHAATAAGGVV
jgi:hypothetical protein